MQRYKFVEDDKSILIRVRQVSEEPLQTVVTEFTQSPPSIRSFPTNEHTYRVSTFIDMLNPARGVRYNIAWSYGDYLFEIPNRLGRSEALDAAADALVAACERFSSSKLNRTSSFLEKYVEAVRTLRVCLDDHMQATSVETLCAVMLLLICQVSRKFLNSLVYADEVEDVRTRQ